MTIKAPAQHPDIQLVRDPSHADTWLDKTWSFDVTRNGIALDLSGSTLTIAVLDDDIEDSTITVDVSQAADGVIGATISNALIKQLRHYSTWQLYESPQYNDVLVQGRFVKQS
jgi:hypothetical protein